MAKDEVHTFTPELKQAGDLVRVDFERHPVWIGVHTADFGMPWYSKSDEETYRPWTDHLPVAATGKILLVTACFELKAGIRLPGFFSPVESAWDDALIRTTSEGQTIRIRSFSERQGGSQLAILKLHQPHVFANAQRFSFWGGRRGISPERRQAFYAAIGEPPENIFPIRFSADPKLVTGIVTGRLDGFYRSIAGQPPVVEL